MSDERIDIWNVFHDGSITVAEQSHDHVVMFVNIPYLRRRLQPLGDSFIVTLSGVTVCEFRHFDGECTSLVEALDVGEPEILSTSSDRQPLTVHTTLGELILSFETLELSLDSGSRVTYESVVTAAKEYWDEFERRGTRLPP